MRKIFFLLGMAAVFALQSCRDKCTGKGNNPYVAMRMVVSPITDSIRLGDTLTLTLEIPFANVNTRNGSVIYLNNSSISEFGIDHLIFTKNGTGDNNTIVEGREQFKILYGRGGGAGYTETRTQNRFDRTDDRFIFLAKVIPLKKGLVKLANYRAEGKMDGGCTTIDFTPSCEGGERSQRVYFDYFGLPYIIGANYAYPNHYYVWAK